jgi:hypothetical protein
VETIDDLDNAMSAIYEDRLRELAGKEMPKSVKTLADLRDDKFVKDNVRRSASNDLIRHGHKHEGRRSSTEAAAVASGDIVINILRFGDGGAREIIHSERRAIVEDVEPEVEPVPIPSPLPPRDIDGD